MTDLLVLGGSGRTGLHVLDQAARRGHRVRALVRNPDTVTAPDGVELMPGTPARIDDLRRAAEGTTAVIVALNNARASDNPWAKPVSPPTFMTDAVRDTLTVMAENGIRRIVVTSAIGVGDSRKAAHPLFRALIAVSNVKLGYRDHDGVDRLIHESDTDWTLARAVVLSDMPSTGPLRAAEYGQDRPGVSISRADVARFLLDAIEQNSWVRQAPLIWNSRDH